MGSNAVLNKVRTGKVIGIFERLVVLTIYLTGGVASIGIVIAAKSFARFKRFDNKDFAEYYLIGTLAIGGIILRTFRMCRPSPVSGSYDRLIVERRQIVPGERVLLHTVEVLQPEEEVYHSKDFPDDEEQEERGAEIYPDLVKKYEHYHDRKYRAENRYDPEPLPVHYSRGFFFKTGISLQSEDGKHCWNNDRDPAYRSEGRKEIQSGFADRNQHDRR